MNYQEKDWEKTGTGALRGDHPSWMDLECSFEGIPLEYVLKELERPSNVKVRTHNLYTELLFSGSFSNTILEMALKSISTPSKILCRIEGDKVLFYTGNTPQ